MLAQTIQTNPNTIPWSHLVSEKELRGSRGDLVVVIGQVNVSLLFHECIGELQLECETQTSALQWQLKVIVGKHCYSKVWRKRVHVT